MPPLYGLRLITVNTQSFISTYFSYALTNLNETLGSGWNLYGILTETLLEDLLFYYLAGFSIKYPDEGSIFK
jgi:hypothetical protein